MANAPARREGTRPTHPHAIRVYLTDAQRSALEERARLLGVTLSDIVRDALDVVVPVGLSRRA
jgi:hypothetical protein